MFNFHHDPERAYPSSHRRIRGAEEMLASIPATPIDVDKQRAVEHYTQLAFEAQGFLGEAALSVDIE